MFPENKKHDSYIERHLFLKIGHIKLIKNGPSELEEPFISSVKLVQGYLEKSG